MKTSNENLCCKPQSLLTLLFCVFLLMNYSTNKMGKPHNSRNGELAGGISKYSRTAVYKKRALYKKKKTVSVKKTPKVELFKTKKIGGDKNGSTRKVAVEKTPRFYPTEDCPKPMPNRKHQRASKLRPSLVPGAVLVLLAGRFRGKVSSCIKHRAFGLKRIGIINF